MTRKKKQPQPQPKPKTITIVEYALRHKESGKLLTYNVSSNGDAEFCGDTTVELDHYQDEPIWYIDKAYNAEYVRQYSTEWYNSGMSCPKHSYDSKELEVVKVTKIISAERVDIRIPTVMEFFAIQYAKEEPAYNAYLQNLYKTQEMKYSFHELSYLISKGEWKPEEGG